MAASSTPILVLGGLTMFKETIVDKKPFDLTVPVFTGMTVLIFAGAEKLAGSFDGIVVGVAYLALITSILLEKSAITPVINFVSDRYKGAARTSGIAATK